MRSTNSQESVERIEQQDLDVGSGIRVRRRAGNERVQRWFVEVRCAIGWTVQVALSSVGSTSHTWFSLGASKLQGRPTTQNMITISMTTH